MVSIVNLPERRQIGIDRLKALVQHLPLRNRPRMLQLLANLAANQLERILPVLTLAVFDWGSDRIRRNCRCLRVIRVFNLLFDRFTFPSSGHIKTGLLSFTKCRLEEERCPA